MACWLPKYPVVRPDGRQGRAQRDQAAARRSPFGVGNEAGRYLAAFAKAGAGQRPAIGDPTTVLCKQIKAKHAAGVAINPHTPFEMIT